jgi:hypothetical protein
MPVTPNEDFLENQECVDCATTISPSTPCSTTTWALAATPACSGTVNVATLNPIEYCCVPVGIPVLESTICADCPCYPVSTVVKTLPAKGTLTLLCDDVTVGQILTEQEEGMLVYTATTVGTADTDTFVLTKKWSCGEADTTVTIAIQEVECEVVRPCAGCN